MLHKKKIVMLILMIMIVSILIFFVNNKIKNTEEKSRRYGGLTQKTGTDRQDMGSGPDNTPEKIKKQISQNKSDILVMEDGKVYKNADEIIESMDKMGGFQFCEKMKEENKKGCFYLLYFTEAIKNPDFKCERNIIGNQEEIKDAISICNYIKSRDKNRCEDIEIGEVKKFCNNLFDISIEEKNPDSEGIKILLNAINKKNASLCSKIKRLRMNKPKKEIYLLYCKKQAQ